MSAELPAGKAEPRLTIEQVLQLFESLIESNQALESKLETVKQELLDRIDEVQTAIEEKIDDIEFEDHYPGLGE